MTYNRRNEIALIRQEMKAPGVTPQGIEILKGLLADYKAMSDAEFNEFMKVCEL